ncbi:hypothetical protein FQN55_003362 [Onygenales sp. PD_40]|nr:hypothetical protein FQN55_003362 [Onygenales sp. PD_40]KAK2799650.1 hypothetical protein FQN51_006782 [Onygenales sp. PD_10]
MGCASSKVQEESQPANIPLQTSRSRPGTNAQSRRGPPPGTAGGRRGTRPPSHAGTRSQSRVPSQAGSKAPSRRGTAGAQSAQRRRQQDRRYSTALGAIPYEQPPEDRAVRDEIRAFRLRIDQHAITFYHTQRDNSGTLIAAYIARRIIEKVIYSGGTRGRVYPSLYATWDLRPSVIWISLESVAETYWEAN